MTDRRGSGRRLVRAARRATAAYGRDDLLGRLDALDAHLDDTRLTAVVLGEFKAGKSSLVNALLGAEVCPVDADVATAVPTVLHHSPTPVARGTRRRGDDGPVELEVIDPTLVADQIRAHPDRWASVEIGLPRRILADGLVLVDTPGVGGLDARHLADALGVLALADVVLYATDSANELGGPALDLLVQVAGIVPEVVLVHTKADLHHHADRIVAANRHHLAKAGLHPHLLVTSAELRGLAIATDDAELNAESGFPELVTLLDRMIARSDELAAARTGAVVADVAAQLRGVLDAERTALSPGEPAATPSPTTEPHQVSWQQLLADDVADLTADLDHDLRRRTRELAAEAEGALADGDPAALWPEVSAWLEERAAADVVATFTLLRDRTATIAARVAERFEATDGGGVPVDPAVIDALARQVLTALPERAALPADGAGKATSGLNALRSSFYGFMMFSSIGALVGVAAAPAALVLGLAIGGKSVRDERQRGHQQRRLHAKGAVRTYLDEVAFVAGKESRDALRLVQRGLRDHFAALAAEQQRSAAEAGAAARRAAAADADARATRRRDLDAEIERVDLLARRAADLAIRAGAEVPA